MSKIISERKTGPMAKPQSVTARAADSGIRWKSQIHPDWPVEKRRRGDTGRGDTLNPFDLSGRIALITGAGRGIGRATAQRLVSLGAHVIVTDINLPGARETKAIVEDVGGTAEVHRFDVADRAELNQIVKSVLETHGRLDILINNAGICTNAPALQTTDEIWERQMRINLDSVFHCCRAFGEHMVRRGSGAIVCLASIAGLIDVRPQDHIAYSVSKAAVAHMARVLASEWAHRGVRVNAVSPGFVATDMPLAAGKKLQKFWQSQIPLGRFLQPYEIANTIAYLAADASSAITGQSIIIDGGFTIW
jgi:NAD(P)-dependent dehydrogenase (short-subunit alcohol dehydrogenase family)